MTNLATNIEAKVSNIILQDNFPAERFERIAPLLMARIARRHARFFDNLTKIERNCLALKTDLAQIKDKTDLFLAKLKIKETQKLLDHPDTQAAKDCDALEIYKNQFASLQTFFRKECAKTTKR